ncbi:MAG: hypothetical protein QME42_07490 [bacterium]|nr:hypothetical protein [bacterium]
MKGISKTIFIGWLLIGFSHQLAYCATDTVKTYHSDWVKSIYFKNGDTILVTANDDGTSYYDNRLVQVLRQDNMASITITLYDDGLGNDVEAGDGTYTGIFKISTAPTSGDNLQLANGQRAYIIVDLDNGNDGATATVFADYTSPVIPEPGVSVSEEYFSPDASYGKKDTILITFKSNENGKYEILIDGETPGGTPTPKGTLSANSTVSFEWNGRNKNEGSFLEGVHTIYVRVWDEAGNVSDYYTCQIWIDNTFPTKVDMFLMNDCFSPGSSPGSLDVTNIILMNDETDLLNYKLSINGEILLGTGTPMGTGTGVIPGKGIISFEWGGRYGTGTPLTEGVHTIYLDVEDNAGNSPLVPISAKVTIDNTAPRIDYLRDDSGGNPVYRNQNVRFILQASDWIAGNPVTANKGVGIATFNGKNLNLVDCGNGIYVQSYKVTQEDVGTFGYTASFVDKAGNPATNNGTQFGTITLRGNEFPPASGSKIVRLHVSTPEKGTFSILSNNITHATSTLTIKANAIKKGDEIKITDNPMDNSHVWITSATKNGEITIANANLFFGFPIADYKNIATSTITEGAWLKGIVKTNDELTINLTAVNKLSDEFDASTYTSTMAIFENALMGIATGTMVVAYDNDDHIWLGTAGTSGRFEVSNANLYFGDLPVDKDYKKLTIKGIRACFANSGEAFANMGIIVQGISLYDNGAYTHKDVKAGDGVYSNVYTIRANATIKFWRVERG